MDISVDLGAEPARDVGLTFSSNMGPGHQHSPGCCRTTDIYVNLGPQHSLTQWSTDSKVASGTSTGHGSFLMRTNPENEPLFMLEVLSFLSQNYVIVWWAACGA